MKTNGTIFTFYSFKGGAGRTMGLANIAVLLAKKHKVLIIDFDLEAPGLDKYLAEFRLKKGKKKGGLLDLVELARERNPSKFPDYRSYIQTVYGKQMQTMHYLSAGDQEDNYSKRVQGFDWVQFFNTQNGALFFEYLRNEFRKNYDYILIDSRTGYSDTSGICTYLLPDILVLFCTANEQSVNGTLEVSEKAYKARQSLQFDRTALAILPVPSRIDEREEYEEAKKWNRIFVSKFSRYYNRWLPKDFPVKRLLEEITIPYVPYYSFGEKLSTLKDSLTNKKRPAYYYYQIAKIIESNFYDLNTSFLHTGVAIDESAETILEAVLNKFKTSLNDRQPSIIRQVAINGSVTNRWCREEFSVVNDTVNRDLNALVDLKILKRIGQGRATKYIAGRELE